MPKKFRWPQISQQYFFPLISFELLSETKSFFPPSPEMVFSVYFWEFFFFGGFFNFFFWFWGQEKWAIAKIYSFLVITKICLCGSWTLNLGGFKQGFQNLKGGDFFVFLRGRVEFCSKNVIKFGSLCTESKKNWMFSISMTIIHNFWFFLFEARFKFRCFFSFFSVYHDNWCCFSGVGFHWHF
jgi:hypothetical protein